MLQPHSTSEAQWLTAVHRSAVQGAGCLPSLVVSLGLGGAVWHTCKVVSVRVRCVQRHLWLRCAVYGRRLVSCAVLHLLAATPRLPHVCVHVLLLQAKYESSPFTFVLCCFTCGPALPNVCVCVGLCMLLLQAKYESSPFTGRRTSRKEAARLRKEAARVRGAEGVG
jgi:hypothetical protein